MSRRPAPQPGSGSLSYLDKVRWVEVTNASGEDAPGGALLRVTGGGTADDDEADDYGVPTVGRPNADGMAGLLVAHPAGIAAGGRGLASPNEFVPVAYDDAETPAVGETWGSAADSWKLTKGKAGWLVAAPPVGSQDLKLVECWRVVDGDGLTTANTDGTEESGTARLEFNKTTGVRVTKGATDEDPDVVDLLAASTSQTGVVNLTSQSFLGNKTLLGTFVQRDTTGTAANTDSASGSASAQRTTAASANTAASVSSLDSGSTYSVTSTAAVTAFLVQPRVVDIASYSTGPATGYAGTTYANHQSVFSGFSSSLLVGVNANGTRGVEFCTPTGNFAGAASFDIYAVPAEWTDETSGPVRHRQNSYVADGSAWGATRSGIDYLGADATVAGLEFVAGLYKGGTLSVPPSPPPPPGSVGTTQLADDAVTNAKLANMASPRLKGRVSSGTGDPEDLTGTQATGMLDVFVASGASAAKGLVPAPSTTAGTTKFLREDAAFTYPNHTSGTAELSSAPVSLAVSSGTWVTLTGLTFTAGVDGVYVVHADIRSEIFATGVNAFVKIQPLIDGTAVSSEERSGAYMNPSSQNAQVTSPCTWRVTMTAGQVFTVQASPVFTGTLTAGEIKSNSNGRSKIVWHMVSEPPSPPPPPPPPSPPPPLPPSPPAPPVPPPPK